MTVDPRFTHVQPVIAKPLRAIGHIEFGWIALIQSHPLSIAWLRGRIGSEGLMQQVHLARACATHMALAYHQVGFAVVIDDFWDAYHDADYQALDANPHLHRVVLYPQQEEAHRRNFQRSGDSPARAFIDEGIQQVYERLNPVIPRLAQDGWLIVDTTNLSVEATVSYILEHTRTLT